MAVKKAAKKRTLSPAGRKKIAEAQKRRWAARKTSERFVKLNEDKIKALDEFIRQNPSGRVSYQPPAAEPSVAPPSPALQQEQDQTETPADVIQRLAGDVTRLQNVVRAHEACMQDDKDTIADYVGILKRELAYHNLRVEEIERDLRLNCIEV